MGKPYGKFVYELGEKIISHGRNLEVIDREYRNKIVNGKDGVKRTQHPKYYKTKCLKCGREKWTLEYYLLKEHRGCTVCDVPFPNQLCVGQNDISSSAPWVVPLLKNKEDAYKYTSYSNAKVEVVCPDCGREFVKSVATIRKNGVACPCKDGRSYPNKFMYSVLEQIGVPFQSEKTFSWSNDKIYDNYIEHNGLKIITEQHGKQHYSSVFAKGRSLQKERENDCYKKLLAEQNGIDYYFEIDCSESTMEYIRDNIVSSGLLTILRVDPCNIDWIECDKFASSNFEKTVCEYQSVHPKLTSIEIAKHFGVGERAVQKYLHHGNELGWCNYSGEESKVRAIHKTAQRRSKPLYCVETGQYFSNASKAAEHFENDGVILQSRNIRKSASTNLPHKGYNFQFVTQEQFNKIKTESPDKAIGDFFII